MPTNSARNGEPHSTQDEPPTGTPRSKNTPSIDRNNHAQRFSVDGHNSFKMGESPLVPPNNQGHGANICSKQQLYCENPSFIDKNEAQLTDGLQQKNSNSVKNEVWFGREQHKTNMNTTNEPFDVGSSMNGTVLQGQSNNQMDNHNVSSAHGNQCAIMPDSSYTQFSTSGCFENATSAGRMATSTSPLTSLARNIDSLTDNEGHQSGFGSATARSEFGLSDATTQQVKQRQTTTNYTGTIKENSCDLTDSVPIKFELSFNATSQTRVENNNDSVSSTKVGTANELQHHERQQDQLNSNDAQNVSRLEELYQFGREYFFETEIERNGENRLGTIPDADLRDLNDSRETINIDNSNANSDKNSGAINEKNKITSERSSGQKSSVTKQQSTVNSVNQPSTQTHNDRDKSLKPSQNCDSSRHLVDDNLADRKETCQGYDSHAETDDRLKQLSLRFSADACRKVGVGGFHDANIGVKLETSSDVEKNDVVDDSNFDIYMFEQNAVVKFAEQTSSLEDTVGKLDHDGKSKASTSSCKETYLLPTETYDEPTDVCTDWNEAELNDLIERISLAHRETCSFLKTNANRIDKRQSISSLPHIATNNNRAEQQQRSPTSSIIDGSAGSSASSVSSGSSSSGGSPMNITSSPTLSPTSNNSATIIGTNTSASSRISSYGTSSLKLAGTERESDVIKPIDKNDELTGSNSVGSLEEYKISLWQEYALLVNPSIQQVVEFAKQVPGFLALNQLDQLLLIKKGFFEIWLVTIAGMFNCADSTLTFADGTYIDREQLDTMFDKTFSAKAFNFSISLNQLCLDDTEIGLVSAIILFQPGRPGIRCTDDVATQQYAVMRALKTKLGRNVHDGLHDARYTDLIVRLKDLENINTIHMHYIDWLRSRSVARLPTLFSEIFDIPISSKSSSSSAISESIGDESLVNDLDESVLDESSGKEIFSCDSNKDKIGQKSNNEGVGGGTIEQQQADRNSDDQNAFVHLSDRDFFFDLASFQDIDDKIDAADLNPTVYCRSTD